MRKGEEFNIKITGHNMAGKPYGVIDGQKYFVDVNAAKDQIVKGFYGKRKSNGIHLVKSIIVDYATE